jgi:hypothetical protein
VPRNDGIDTGIGSFLPRFGVAYTITPTTVLRAGYGMSADSYSWHVLRNAYPAVLLDTNTPQNTSNYIPAASLTGLNGSGLGSGSYSVPSGIILAPLPNLNSGTIPLPTNISTTTIPNPFNRGFINSYNLFAGTGDPQGYVVHAWLCRHIRRPSGHQPERQRVRSGYGQRRWHSESEVACPATFVPVEMRQTGIRGAVYGTREEGYGGADRESAATG